tara:strand:+ start:721 stop:1140 length:420 start_codon:yes stop_codon:yes gene_type:complete
VEYSLDKYIKFHKKYGGTGKLFKFKLINYSKGNLELEGEFNDSTLNPDGSVQGGMMTAMLDDVTSLLIIIETKGQIYPASTDLHTLHHRPLNKGKVKAKAAIIKKGKKISTTKGELFDKEGQLATTLMHTSYLIEKTIK